jgi:hypothetical protein
MPLTESQRSSLERLCEALVPGSAAVGPTVYVEALLEGMPPEMRGFAVASIEELGAAEELGALAHTPGFGLVRALAIEAYYSDFVAPGRDAPGAWADIDFNSPQARRLARDFSWLGGVA